MRTRRALALAVAMAAGPAGAIDPLEEGRRVLREVFHADGWGVVPEGDFEAVARALPPAPPRAAPAGATRR